MLYPDIAGLIKVTSDLFSNIFISVIIRRRPLLLSQMSVMRRIRTLSVNAADLPLVAPMKIVYLPLSSSPTS
jgi:hypothetical protein